MGADLSESHPGWVAIPAGQNWASGGFTLVVNDDDVVESLTESVRVEVVVTAGGLVLPVTADTVVVNIRDNDLSLALSVSPQAVVEQATAHAITVTASLPGSTASAQTVTVTIAAGGGADGATLGATGDFTTDQTGNAFTITIPSGSVSATATFNLTARADGTAETGLEKVAVSGSISTEITASVELAISDGPASLSVLAPDGGTLVPPMEGSGTSTVSLQVTLPAGVTAPAGGATARFRVVGGTATADDGSRFDAGEDFRILYGSGAVSGDSYPGRVQIAAGASSGTGSFRVVVNNDRDVELPPAETVMVEAVLAGGGLSGLPASAASFGIADNDGVTLSWLADDDTTLTSVVEGNSVEVKVKAAWDQAFTHTQPITVTVSIGADIDSAEAGTHYAPVSPFDLTIAAGVNSQTGSLTLDMTGDYDDNRYRGFKHLRAVGTAAAPLADVPVKAGRLTIRDDEPAPLPPPDTGGGGGPSRPEGCDFRFCDAEGSAHQSSIGLIAQWGITTGCSTSEPWRFCPQQHVPRRQMAAFLYRAVTRQTGAVPVVGDDVELADVPEDAWYRDYAQWAVSIGAADAEFEPAAEISRAEMATWLVAAFAHIVPGLDQARGLFADMAGQDPAVIRAAEALYQAGVTVGCNTNPLRYCPDRSVTRAQMATFITRALNIDPVFQN